MAFKEEVRARCEKEDSEFHDLRSVFFPTSFSSEDLLGTQEINKAIDFSGATFLGEAFFFLANFFNKAVFSRVIFAERAFCLDATFRQEADFSNVTFMKEALFSGTNFIETASFSGSTFMSEADFSHATFMKQALFSDATFMGKGSFFLANFMNGTFFSGLKIQDRLLFYACNSLWPGLTAVFNGEFRHLNLIKKSLLCFQDIYLGQVSLLDTDLRQVEFQHVQWHPYRGRQAIYDEVLLRQVEKEQARFRTWLFYYAPYANIHASVYNAYGRVERLYRYLKINYETQEDYKNSGDFHYGEMEMHRRASKWRWFPGYWYNLYWFLSGYGERPSRAFGLLLSFLAALTVLLTWAGLDVDPKHVPAFGDSFFYLLQKVTLQRPTWAEPIGFWGKLVAGTSVLIIPGQAALFLLALRNRLGRRR